ncbi:MAG: outer membrane lipoprotein carrier protein LolA [Verrucomicrobia bacterium]|nr:outer membrane lipoprotein carrier protein LolA [Cytophagales bacterium]
MKKLPFIIILSFFITAVQAQNDVKAGQILESVSQKYKTVPAFKANFTILRESSANGVKPETDLGAIKVKGSKYHIKLKEQEVFNNGNTVWTYLKKGNEATITDYMPDDDALSPTNIYTIYKKGYKYVFVEEAKEAGQTYEVVDLIPEKKNQQVYKIKLTIDKKTKTLKRWKVFEKNGNRYTYTINDFVPLNIEDKEFVFDKAKYPGVAIEDLR